MDIDVIIGCWRQAVIGADGGLAWPAPSRGGSSTDLWFGDDGVIQVRGPFSCGSGSVKFGTWAFEEAMGVGVVEFRLTRQVGYLYSKVDCRRSRNSLGGG